LFSILAPEKSLPEGFTIIASFGGQQSDRDGGYTERTDKLPNPFYKIP